MFFFAAAFAMSSQRPWVRYVLLTGKLPHFTGDVNQAIHFLQLYPFPLVCEVKILKRYLSHPMLCTKPQWR